MKVSVASDSRASSAFDGGGVRVGKVLFLEAGDAEGGLGALVRFMGAAYGIALPPPTPAGWYWTATVAVRGVWVKGPCVYATQAEAESAMVEALVSGPII